MQYIKNLLTSLEITKITKAATINDAEIITTISSFNKIDPSTSIIKFNRLKPKEIKNKTRYQSSD